MLNSRLEFICELAVARDKIRGEGDVRLDLQEKLETLINMVSGFFPKDEIEKYIREEMVFRYPFTSSVAIAIVRKFDQ